MPIVKIHMRAGSTPQRKSQIVSAVEAAMVAAFKIPASDVFALLHEYPEGSITNKGPKFIYVEISALAGRSTDAKRALYRHIVDKLNAFDTYGPADILTMLHDMPAENCGVRGGQMASEVNLGFEVKV